MSQDKRPTKLNLFPTVVEADDEGFHDPRFADGEIYTDKHGRQSVMVGGQLRPLRRPGDEVAEMLQIEMFDKIGELLVDRVIHGDKVASTMRVIIRDQINTQYADSWFGRIQGGLAKWDYDRNTYHPQRKEFRVAMTEMMTGQSASQNAMVATVMAAYVEQTRRTLTDPFEMADYLRERGRYERESTFEDKRVQEPVTIANAHELAKIDRETDRLIGLAKLETEARTAERADAALEADKNRSLEMYRETLGLTTDMANAINELRMIEQQQPTAQVIAAMEVLRATMDSAAAWATSLDEETKKRMAPYLAKMAGDAIAQAMRAARRG